MSDQRDDLLKEIGDALRVDPSPSFAAGVRTRIAKESGHRRGWLMWFGWAGTAAAVAAGIAILSISRRVEFAAPVPVSPPVVARVETPVAATPLTSAPSVASDTAITHPARRAVETVEASVATDPPLIVQTNQRSVINAIWARMMPMQDGGNDAGVAEPGTPPSISDLIVTPIVVSAIEPIGPGASGGAPVIRRAVAESANGREQR